MSDDNSGILGAYSFIGTYALLIFIAVKTGALAVAWANLPQFFLGGPQAIITDKSFLAMTAAMVAIVTVETPCSLGGLIVEYALIGKAKGRNVLADQAEYITYGNHFFPFFIMMIGEELLARGLFLGLLPKLPFLSGRFAFYALFLVGNGIWALIHLENYKDPQDRKLLRVLPQFISGVFYTYIFVEYGLLASILTHTMSNSLLFSLLRYQKVGIVDGLIVLYAAITGGVSYRLMDKPITDIAIWFSQTPTFALPGWSFWDYLKFSVFASSMLMLVFGLLVYDRGEAGRERKMGLLTLALASIIVVYLLYFLYYILGFFIADIPVRLLVLAITLTLVEKQTSTSSMARSFWTGLPAIYVTVCIVQALGFWPAAWCILAEAIIFIPSTILVSADD